MREREPRVCLVTTSFVVASASPSLREKEKPVDGVTCCCCCCCCEALLARRQRTATAVGGPTFPQWRVRPLAGSEEHAHTTNDSCFCLSLSNYSRLLGKESNLSAAHLSQERTGGGGNLKALGCIRRNVGREEEDGDGVSRRHGARGTTGHNCGHRTVRIVRFSCVVSRTRISTCGRRYEFHGAC
jgi:hypothetical protein